MTDAAKLPVDLWCELGEGPTWDAVAGVGAKNPLLFLEAAADSTKPEAFRELASQLALERASDSVSRTRSGCSG